MDFTYTRDPEPHSSRARDILRRHPEIRELIRPHPRTFWWVVGLVALQMGMAALLAPGPWWVVVVAAYLAGAFITHALGVLIHDCAHRLVFRNSWANILTGMLANLPVFFPSSRLFQTYHLKHHAYLGVYDVDGDLPSRWEARLAGRSPVGKALWLLMFPVIQLTRLYRLKNIRPIDGWMIVNTVVQLAFNVGVYLVLGPWALLYLALSLYFSISLHFLGGRWVQEHFLPVSGSQETFSYYGPLNRLTFNVGHHAEHHDFTGVAWVNLPKLRRAAPETYDAMHWHGSLSKVLLGFLFDRQRSLFARVLREHKGHQG
ncbi:MAG TPA: fatty acid desaturase [Candidatus Bathyarchaeia archaeon]|nr:fatty acid desaturase [Candidatus Bathyarchaeia archaeon]